MQLIGEDSKYFDNVQKFVEKASATDDKYLSYGERDNIFNKVCLQFNVEGRRLSIAYAAMITELQKRWRTTELSFKEVKEEMEEQNATKKQANDAFALLASLPHNEVIGYDGAMYITNINPHAY